MILDSFPFHKLLQDTSIKELEKLLSEGGREFKVGRIGTYVLSSTRTTRRSALYKSTKHGDWWITKKTVNRVKK